MVATKPVNFFTPFPEIQQSAQALQRRQALADALSQQASTPLEANQSSGRYIVPINPLQGVSKLGQALLARSMQNDLNQQGLLLAKQQNNEMGKLFGAAPEGQQQASQAPVAGQQQPMPNAAPAAIGGRGPLTMSGMDPATARLMYALAPESYVSKLIESRTPTNEARRDKELNIDPKLASALEQAKRQKEGTQSFAPGTTVVDPSGHMSVAADLNNGIQGGYGPNGAFASAVPGAAGAKAAMDAAKERAVNENKIFTSQTVNGRENVPVTGAQIMGQRLSQPEIGPRPAGWNGRDDAGLEPGKPTFGQTAGEKSFGEASGPMQTRIIEKGYEAANAARDTIDNVHFAKDSLLDGALTGPGADWRVGLGRAVQFLGVDNALQKAGFDFADPEKISNSVKLRSALGNQMLSKVRTLGANPTDEDRRVLQGIIGSLDTDPAAMNKLLDWTEKQATQSIEIHNKNVKKALSQGFKPFTNLEVELPSYQNNFPVGGMSKPRVVDFNSLPQ